MTCVLITVKSVLSDEVGRIPAEDAVAAGVVDDDLALPDQERSCASRHPGLATLPVSICRPSIQKVAPVEALPVSMRSPMVDQFDGIGLGIVAVTL